MKSLHFRETPVPGNVGVFACGCQVCKHDYAADCRDHPCACCPYPQFHMTITHTASGPFFRRGAEFGPYTDPSMVLSDVPPDSLRMRGKYRAILRLNGGASKNKEHGGTMIVNWSGRLMHIVGTIEPILDAHAMGQVEGYFNGIGMDWTEQTEGDG